MLGFLRRTAPITALLLAVAACSVTVLGVAPSFVVGPVVAYVVVLVFAAAWYTQDERRSWPRRVSSEAVLPPSTRPPAQLPPLPLFVGRQEALDRVLAALREGRGQPRERPRVVLVTGQPGIGKTAFAIRLAHAIAGDYPGGSLFARLGDEPRGTDRPPAYVKAFISALEFWQGPTAAGQGSLRALLRPGRF